MSDVAPTFTAAEIRVLVAMRATQGGYKAIAAYADIGKETARDHVQAIAKKLPPGGRPPFQRVLLFVLTMPAPEFAALESQAQEAA